MRLTILLIALCGCVDASASGTPPSRAPGPKADYGECVDGVCEELETCETVAVDAVCGNGIVENGETCDEADANGTGTADCEESCTCNATCSGYTNANDGDYPTCGNGVVEDGEACDDGDENGTSPPDCVEDCNCDATCSGYAAPSNVCSAPALESFLESPCVDAFTLQPPVADVGCELAEEQPYYEYPDTPFPDDLFDHAIELFDPSTFAELTTCAGGGY